MKKLTGKVALVTGSDSGIGKAIAVAFAREGAKVVVCYHTDKQGAADTLRQIEMLGSTGITLQADVTNEQSVESLFQTAIDHFQSIDILVNNAGVSGSGSQVSEMATEDFDRTVRTNLYGPFFFCRRFINHRRQKGGKGKIINVSSVHEEIVMAGYADYNASKAGLRNLMRTMALELAEEGINVNNICPGMILTPMNQEAVQNEQVRSSMEQHIPMKRAGLPEEIAPLAVFLASADSDYVTGSSYFADGGLMLQVGQGA